MRAWGWFLVLLGLCTVGAASPPVALAVIVIIIATTLTSGRPEVAEDVEEEVLRLKAKAAAGNKRRKQKWLFVCKRMVQTYKDYKSGEWKK